MTLEPTLPETCAVAFKEWSGICSALAKGRQCLILRKGGIEEGPGGFRPEHDVFWLYPTRLHEAQQGLREPVPPLPVPPEGQVELSILAVVTLVRRLERPALLPALEPFHVWNEETVRNRFQYRNPGLWVLGVRVFRREDPWRIDESPDYAGCKTWVPLEQSLPTTALEPALDLDDFQARMNHLESVPHLSS